MNAEIAEQGALFTPERSIPLDAGYRGQTACAAAGISYRQLDYWARTGLVGPTIRPAAGSGSQRLYGFRDILVLKIVKRLLALVIASYLATILIVIDLTSQTTPAFTLSRQACSNGSVYPLG